MSARKSELEQLEAAIRSMGLTPEAVLINSGNEKISGFSIFMEAPTDLHELMRRTRGLSAEFLPHEQTDNVVVVHLRDC